MPIYLRLPRTRFWKMNGSIFIPPPDVSTETLLELECHAVSMMFESRPRSKGMKFSIGVGGLFLRDHITVNSIMPVLVAPQMRVSFYQDLAGLPSKQQLRWLDKEALGLSRGHMYESKCILPLRDNCLFCS